MKDEVPRQAKRKPASSPAAHPQAHGVADSDSGRPIFPTLDQAACNTGCPATRALPVSLGMSHEMLGSEYLDLASRTDEPKWCKCRKLSRIGFVSSEFPYAPNHVQLRHKRKNYKLTTWPQPTTPQWCYSPKLLKSRNLFGT